MGSTLWKGAVWTPYAEGVTPEERVAIVQQMKLRLNTLELRGGQFDGYVAIQLPIYYHKTSRILTVACEQADKFTPVTTRTASWHFQYLDQDVVAFRPKRWWFVDVRSGLRVQDGGQ